MAFPNDIERMCTYHEFMYDVLFANAAAAAAAGKMRFLARYSIYVGFIYYAVAEKHFVPMQNCKRNDEITKQMRMCVFIVQIKVNGNHHQQKKQKRTCKRLANGAHYSSFIKCTGTVKHTFNLHTHTHTQTK